MLSVGTMMSLASSDSDCKAPSDCATCFRRNGPDEMLNFPSELLDSAGDVPVDIVLYKSPQKEVKWFEVWKV